MTDLWSISGSNTLEVTSYTLYKKKVYNAWPSSQKLFTGVAENDRDGCDWPKFSVVNWYILCEQQDLPFLVAAYNISEWLLAFGYVARHCKPFS